MIYTNSDGGARGNPGPGAVGFLVRKDDEILKTGSKTIGNVTNNQAEYQGLIEALKLASEFTNDEITCILDSELIVKQLTGEYQIRNPQLLELFVKVQKLQENFKRINYKHVKRSNKYQVIVDGFLNEALDNSTQ